MCESFNAWILESRYKPIIDMLEEIRKQVMVRMRDKRIDMTKRLEHGRRYGKRIYERVEDSIVKSRNCTAMWNGDTQYEIGGCYMGTTVDLKLWTCTCRPWQLCGVPCCHSESAITLTREDPEDYVYECLKGETYMKTYETMLRPVNGKEYWPPCDKPVLLPPPTKVLPGRPKWMRRKDASEKDDPKGKGTPAENLVPVQLEEDPYKKAKGSRKGMKTTCRIYKKGGHNSRMCPDKQGMVILLPIHPLPMLQIFLIPLLEIHQL